jgi:hypothetical protein
MLAAASCGPYPNLAEKLDVTTPITDGETWIAVNGTETRVLILPEAPGVPAAFSFTALETPVSAGTSSYSLTGEWIEAAGTATFTVRLEYLLPDESDEPLLSRTGATRKQVDRVLPYAIGRSPGRLVLDGDPAMAGTYVPLREALALLGTATERDAACGFQVANVAMRATFPRVLGFGGPGMTQYQTRATFLGTLAGSFEVFLEGFLDSTTTFTFVGLVELGGTHVDGIQITHVDASGDGELDGSVSYWFLPRAVDGSDLAVIHGAIDFGGGGDPGDAVRISGGTASGGHYVSTLEGGGIARVSPVEAPSPSVAGCLALP